MISKIAFISRYQAEQMKAPTHGAIISFHDSSEAPAQLDPQWTHRLTQRFHDKDHSDGGLYEIFTEDHAKEIQGFLDRLGDTDILYVHCQMGVSRSAGAALAISEFLNVPCFAHQTPVDSFRYKVYNRRVYRILTETLHGLDSIENYSFKP